MNDTPAMPSDSAPLANTINDEFLGLLRFQMRYAGDCRNVYGGDETPQAGKPSQFMGNAMLGTLDNLAPKDEIEGMLIGQIIVMHNAMMQCLQDAIQSKYGSSGYYYKTSELLLANKCTRSFTMLVDTLNRYRGKGSTEQRITVQHVHVAEGGQAIVGNVASDGRGDSKKSGKPHAS